MKLGLLIAILVLQFITHEVIAGSITLTGTFKTDECRRCLDHFRNSYYCSSDIELLGSCCPFPTRNSNIFEQVSPLCVQSEQLG